MSTKPIIALITFYSRTEPAETLALSVAVGCVQARANIRMRRMTDPEPDRVLAEHPDDRDTLVRMHKEYVPPTEADVLAVDALVLGSTAGVGPSSAEWTPYVSLLTNLGRHGRLGGKVGAVVNTGDTATMAAFTTLLEQCGVEVVPIDPEHPEATPDAAKAHGRRLAAAAQALKQNASA